MSQCTRPGCQGTVRDGHCDYCGFAPPKAPVSKPDEGRSTASLPGPVMPVDSGRTGSGRPSPYGPLEMAGVPPVAYLDPETAVLSVPEVAESKRYCSGCNEPVGRRSGDAPARTEGRCPNCHTRFSFTPKLRPGELVGGQYKVRGCLAHGGLGWIYLAHDNNVGHWVVLKGLLDTGADVSDLPAVERAALAQVNHPNIVKIHNFVQHPAPERGTGRDKTQSYIVMEYIGGRTLKQLLDDQQHRSGPAAVLPVDHVIAYGIEMLRALRYLHGKGLLYCDLKPANVMQCEQRLTLIDLGATRRMAGSAAGAPIWGTYGYRAPEVDEQGPSISSDLYTVGRTMAVLSFPFDFTGEFATSLPPQEKVPVLTQFESYYRLLRRATHEDPRQRFRSAAEMVEQLFGVLREVVSVPLNAEPWPVPSTLFGRERRAVGTEIITTDGTEPVLQPLDPVAAAAALPVPMVSEAEGDEPDEVAGVLTDLSAEDPAEIVETLTGRTWRPALLPEAQLVLAGAHLDLGHQTEAERLLNELRYTLPEDWRVNWYCGVAALVAGRCQEAKELFDDLYTRLPGEAAPKLALAFCCEAVGDREEAARRYESVWRTDRGYVSAAFGLARVRLHMGDRAGAVAALHDVSSLSSHYGAAQLAAMAAAVRGRPLAELSEEDLLAAEQDLVASRVDGERQEWLTAELLEAGLAWVLAGRRARPGACLRHAPLTEEGLRPMLEGTYRELARYAKDADDKHALVIKANAVRRWTLL